MLTPEQSHALALSPLPLPRVVYKGAIWAGIQVTDNFQSDVNKGANGNSMEVSRHHLPANNILHRVIKNSEYDGIYKDAVNISMADAMALFGDTE